MTHKHGYCRHGCQSPQGGCCCLGHPEVRLKGLLGEPGAVLGQTVRQSSRKSPTCYEIAPPRHQVDFHLLCGPLFACEPLLLILFLLFLSKAFCCCCCCYFLYSLIWSPSLLFCRPLPACWRLGCICRRIVISFWTLVNGSDNNKRVHNLLQAMAFLMPDRAATMTVCRSVVAYPSKHTLNPKPQTNLLVHYTPTSA